MKKVRLIIVGAGGRGTIYARHALQMPESVEVVAVADPRDFFRDRVGEMHHIPEEKQTCSVSLFPFVSWFLLIFGIIAGITLTGTVAVMAVLHAPATVMSAVALSIFGVALMVFALKFVSAILSYHTNGIAIESGKLTAYSGGFNKNITVFMAKHLVAVEDVTTPLRRKHGIASPVMHLKTNESTNEIKVHIQKAELFDELEKLLIT